MKKIFPFLAALSCFGQTPPPPSPTPTQSIHPDSVGATVSASFIYWQPLQDSFDLGKINPHGGASLPTIGLTTKDFNFEFVPGFQAGLGADFNYDGFSIYSQYTWLASTESTSVQTTSPAHIIPSWLSPGNTGDANAVSNRWKFWFNIADLSLRRVSMLGMKMAFVPFVGGRFLWIDQTLISNITLATGNKAVSYTKASGWFLGPRIGIEGNWFVGGGCKVIGNFDFSILYADFSTHHTESNVNTTPNDLVIDASSTSTGFKPNFDFTVGFGWETDLRQGREHLDLSLQYDWLFFLESNFLSAAAGRSGPINLTLNGLTLKTTLKF